MIHEHYVYVLSPVRLYDLMAVACQAPLSMGFSMNTMMTTNVPF